MPVEAPVKSNPPVNDTAPSAGNTKPSLIDSIPLPLVLWLASPYLAGKTCQDAITKAHQIYKENRFTSTIDILGEDATNVQDCENYVTAYLAVIDAVAAQQIQTARPQEQITVSLKPSMFSAAPPTDPRRDIDSVLADAYDRIKRVVHHAKEKGVKITVEAEDHRWTDFHLNTYFSLINAGYTNAGTVLQSRLFRTKEDLKRFDERMRVRMVIGIYNEPASIAYTEKPQMKEILVDYAGQLANRGTYVEIASHDEGTIGKFIERVAIPLQLPATAFETQFLLGVPRKELQQQLVSGQYFINLAQNASSKTMDYLSELARSGSIVRMYLPYGKDHVAGPYCKRRLKANPNMISYGIKNFFHLK